MLVWHYKNQVGVPIVAQWLTNPTRNMRLRVRSLALLSGLRIWHCRELWCTGHRQGSDPALLWLWCRPGAAVPIRTLAWELPYVASAVLKSKTKTKTGYG